MGLACPGLDNLLSLYPILADLTSHQLAAINAAASILGSCAQEVANEAPPIDIDVNSGIGAIPFCDEDCNYVGDKILTKDDDGNVIFYYLQLSDGANLGEALPDGWRPCDSCKGKAKLLTSSC